MPQPTTALSDLVAVLANVRGRIARYRGQTIGEENTKHALIEPVLSALGWDITDLDEVTCEYRLKQGDNPVDYALFVQGNLRLFVEAKALGENLDRSASQIMGYVGVAGIVEWIVLTDGNEYRIYNAHAPVPVDQKLFKRVVLADDEPEDAATLVLLSKAQLQGTMLDDLWDQYFVDRQVKRAVEGLSGLEPAKDFVSLIRKRVPTLSLTEVRLSLGRAALSLEYRTTRPPRPPSIGTRVGAPVMVTTADPIPVKGDGDKTPWRHVTLADLIAAGAVRLPQDLETTYKKHQLVARIEIDATVSYDGVAYDSLSMAGGMARKSVVGAPSGREYPPTNGWTFWQYRRADGKLATLDDLRRELYERKVVTLDSARRVGA